MRQPRASHTRQICCTALGRQLAFDPTLNLPGEYNYSTILTNPALDWRAPGAADAPMTATVPAQSCESSYSSHPRSASTSIADGYRTCQAKIQASVRTSALSMLSDKQGALAVPATKKSLQSPQTSTAPPVLRDRKRESRI